MVVVSVARNVNYSHSPFAGGDNARISQEAVWWPTDSDVSVSPFAAPLYFHQDLSELSLSSSSILHPSL